MSVLADDVAAHDWSVTGAGICGKPGRSMATLTWQRHICTSAAVAELIWSSCLEVGVLEPLDPQDGATCARSKSYCGRRNRPTAPPAPPARAGSLCAGHAQQLGGESLLPNLMEVKGS